MKEPQSQQTLRTEEEVTRADSGEEATLVAPRFDDEETLVARPVVPLDPETAEMHAPAPEPYATTTAASPAYARRSPVPRRSWVLALVLTSVLVGGVLGGAGLYIYQRQSQDDRAVANPQAEILTETPAESQTQQPAPAPAAEASNAPQPEAPATVAAPTDAVEAAPEAVEDETVTAPPAREPETEPAAARRDDAEAGRDTGTRKRGKKGEHDEAPAPRRPVARAEADNDPPREARRVDTIFYRERRAMRRERARARRDGGDVDRLRRIFEGTP
jgi:hypothetical protein